MPALSLAATCRCLRCRRLPRISSTSTSLLSFSLTFTLITPSFGLYIHSFLLYCISDLQRCLPSTLMDYLLPIHPTGRDAQICDSSITTMSTTSSTYSPVPLFDTSSDTDNSGPGPQNQLVVSLVSNPSSTTTVPTPASPANLTSSPSSPAMPSIPVSRAPLPRGGTWCRF